MKKEVLQPECELCGKTRVNLVQLYLVTGYEKPTLNEYKACSECFECYFMKRG